MTLARDCARSFVGDGGLSFLHGDSISRIGCWHCCGALPENGIAD
jgi:hypothetical protein